MAVFHSNTCSKTEISRKTVLGYFLKIAVLNILYTFQKSNLDQFFLKNRQENMIRRRTSRLTHFKPMLHFYAPRKRQKISGFRAYRNGTLASNGLILGIFFDTMHLIEKSSEAITKNFKTISDISAKAFRYGLRIFFFFQMAVFHKFNLV